MMRVSLAAAGFIIMSCVTAHAMTFADRPSDSQGKLTSRESAPLRFEDRPRNVSYTKRASVERLRGGTARPRLTWTGPMNVEQRRTRGGVAIHRGRRGDR